MTNQLNMKIIILAVFAICFSLQKNHAQLKENLSMGLESNSIWYNDDKKTGSFYDNINDDSDKHFRSNNYLKFDYKFLDNFTANIQLESYEPLAILNYSPNFNNTNLATFSLNFKNKKLDITAGHYYEQFGSGLIFRSWEDRQLGINNALFGGKITYKPMEDLYLTVLYGKHRVGFKTSKGEIFGFNSDINLSNLLNFDRSSLSIGASYIGRKQALEIENPELNELTNAFSGRFDFSHKNFYSSVEYIEKKEDALVQFNQISNRLKKGYAFLLNTGYSKKGFGTNLTFRRLENMSFFSDREKSRNDYNENLVNYIPALTKQHDYLLSNIYVYQAQPYVSFQDPTLLKTGEIGGQIDVFYSIKKDTWLGGKNGVKLASNFSYYTNLDGNYEYDILDYETKFIGFGEKYYSDINFEIRKKWNPKWSSIFYYINQYYHKRFIDETFGKVITNIGVAETTIKIGKGRSLRIEGQHLWTKDDKKNWAGATFEINLNTKLSFYFNDIYNYGNDNEDSQIHYYNVGGSFSKGATRFALNYGRQRGGLLCVGGVCRYVAESTGLAINLATSF